METLVLNAPQKSLLKSSYQKKIPTKIFLPKKIPKSKISTPPKSFDYPCLLTFGVPPPPPAPGNSS